MDIQWWNILIGGGAFLVAIVTTLVGVGWRIRGLEASLREKAEEEAYRAVRKHVEAEHIRDSEGRTIRERIGVLEATCKQRHLGG